MANIDLTQLERVHTKASSKFTRKASLEKPKSIHSLLLVESQLVEQVLERKIKMDTE